MVMPAEVRRKNEKKEESEERIKMFGKVPPM